MASARNAVARRQHGRLTVQSAGLNTCREKGPEGLLGHAPVSNLGRPAGRALMSNPRPLSEEGTGDAGRVNHCSTIPGIYDKAAMTLSASADFECATVFHKFLAFAI